MNLKNVCRTCFRIPKHPRNLFDDRNLIKKIEVIAAIVIENFPELPQQICEECFTNINIVYNFRKVIINTDIDLRTRLDTLKNTNYTSKPRSKIKNESEIDLNLHPTNVIKSESPTIINGNSIDINDNDDSKEDLTTLRDIAIKKIFKCRNCKQIFATKNQLQNHRKTLHTPPGVCNICGAVVRADNLKKHIKLHSDNPCKCNECDKVFKNSESLRSHKFIHSQINYTCEICGKTSKIKAEHTRHLKKHKDPDYRKISCSVCGKKVNEIKKHMLSHTGEKPYNCQFCNKGFTSRYALKIHKRQHTNEKPYKCDYCDYAFTQKVSLMTHVRSKHRI